MLDDNSTRKEGPQKSPGHRLQVRESVSAPYWILVKDRPGPISLEVYVTELTSQGRVLPIFGSEEEARASVKALETRGESAGWRPRRAGTGELVSMLSASPVSAGPCAGVEKVAFDPLPEFYDEPELSLVTTSRRCFIDRLMGRGRSWFEGSKGSKGR